MVAWFSSVPQISLAYTVKTDEFCLQNVPFFHMSMKNENESNVHDPHMSSGSNMHDLSACCRSGSNNVAISMDPWISKPNRNFGELAVSTTINPLKLELLN